MALFFIYQKRRYDSSTGPTPQADR
jgi:hypothetical protein